jgi:hypothetical protein
MLKTQQVTDIKIRHPSFDRQITSLDYYSES